MFERIRHSRSNRSKKERRTHRVQRGGEFAVVGSGQHGMLAPAATDAADIAIWHAGIDAAKLGDQPLDLKILFTDRAVVANDDTPAKKVTRINTWFKFIGEQDTVALIAITYIQREFLKLVLATVNPLVNGIKRYTTAAEIDALTGEDLTELVNVYEARINVHQGVLMPMMQRLIKQFEAVLNMGVGTVFNRPAGITASPQPNPPIAAALLSIPPYGIPSVTNKFEAMFSESLPTFEEKVSEFKNAMLNPARVTNVMVQRIVDTIKLYSSKPDILADDLKLIKGGTRAPAGTSVVTVADSKSSLEMMIRRHVEDCRGAVSLLTGINLRDGWVTGGRFVYFSDEDRPSDLPATMTQANKQTVLTTVGFNKLFVTARDDNVTITDFWTEFYETMETQFTPPNGFATLLFTHDDYEWAGGVVTAIHYGQIAAKVLLAKLNNVPVENLLPPAATPVFFDDKNAPPPRGLGFAGIPDLEYYAVPYKSGKTLKDLYNYVDSNITARLIKYIEYQLNKA